MTTTNVQPWLSHRQRTPASVCDTIVLHATAGDSAKGAIDTLRARGLSYHAVCEKDGHVFKLVPLESVAFHAGSSYGPHEQALGKSHEQGPDQKFKCGCSVNGYTFSFSFVNRNDGHDPYTLAQEQAVMEWCREVLAQHPEVKWITTHALVSPHRKTDPLEFDVDALAGALELKVWRYGQ